jgi:hypothetical protein
MRDHLQEPSKGEAQNPNKPESWNLRMFKILRYQHFSPGGGKGDWQQCLQSIISLYFFLFLLVHAGSISSAKDPNQP